MPAGDEPATVAETSPGMGTAGPTDGGVPRAVPRRPLPTGRAAVGGLLVALAVLGALTVSDRGGPTRMPVVVPARAIGPGTVLGEADLTVVTVAEDPVVARSTFRDPAEVIGATTLGPVGAGEPLTRGDVLRRPPGTDAAPAYEVSVLVPPERAVGGTIKVGERLGVLWTTRSDDGRPRTVAVASRAVVVGLGPVTDLGGSTLLVTLGLDSYDEAAAVAHAAATGDVTLLRGGAVPGAGVAADGGASGGRGGEDAAGA